MCNGSSCCFHITPDARGFIDGMNASKRAVGKAKTVKRSFIKPNRKQRRAERIWRR